MQIETLKMFCDLIETGSFTRASELNQVTQSAISQQVSALEGRFGSRLVQRKRRALTLTEEGRLLYGYGKQITHTYNVLFRKLREVRENLSSTIRLASIYSIGLYDLPPHLKAFLRAYPSVNVRLELCHFRQVYEEVLGNAADLGLVAYPQRESKLEILPLRRERLVLICHPRHRLAKAGRLNLKGLQGQNFVHFGPDIPTRRAIDRALAKARVRVNPVMEFDNIETVKRAVEVEAGVAIVPQPTIVGEVHSHTLAAVELEGKDLFRQLAIIYRKKRKVLSPSVQELIKNLRNGDEATPLK